MSETKKSRPITPEEFKEVKGLLESIKLGDERLSDFEREFVKDQEDRIKKFSADIFLSDKQIIVLKKIEAKLAERDDSQDETETEGEEA